MSTEVVEELVVAKKQLEAQNQQLFAILGLAVLAGAKPGDNGKTELRISKAQIDKNGGRQVTVRGLRTGGLVVTVTKKETD